MSFRIYSDPPGRFMNQTGGSECIECGKGRHASDIARKSSCTDCSAGRSQPQTGATDCLGCAPGTYQNLTASFTCNHCPQNSYQDLLGNTTCHACPSGFSNEIKGSMTCNAIPPGSYFWNKTIRRCKPGHFCLGETFKQPCATGRYATEFGSVECFPCAPGNYADEEQSIRCKACPGKESLHDLFFYLYFYCFFIN